MSHGTWDLPPQVGLRTHTATVCGEIVSPQSFDVRRIGFVLTQLGGGWVGRDPAQYRCAVTKKNLSRLGQSVAKTWPHQPLR